MYVRSHERAMFLQDVIINAVEGGTGYWASVSGYRWDDDTPEEASATLWPEDEPDTSYEVTIETIARGISLILDEQVRVSETIRRWIASGDRENDAGDIDADAADCIVQAGLFHEIIYG